MAKTKTHYECSECGATSIKWMGQCKICKAWGTLEETIADAATTHSPVGATPAPLPPKQRAKPISQIPVEDAKYISSDISELDRVLGGGLVPGAVILLAGEPGVGKSTLLLELAGAMAAQTEPARTNATSAGPKTSNSRPVLYLTGEESAAQVRLRAERIGALHDNLLLASETELETVLGHIEAAQPKLVIVDSVQTISSTQAEGAAGGVTQVRAVTGALIAVAKKHAIPVLLVGHVTKTGGIAGPRVLEHLVDVVCQFEGDRFSRLRLLRAVKNRYGPTDEVGCFELDETGLKGLADPSGLFLSQAPAHVPGTCITITLEGRRPMPIELQALVSPIFGQASARRATNGIERSRVDMILAVLQTRLGLKLHSADVYVSTVGGAQTSEPTADLGIAIAIASAAYDKPARLGLAAIGEVSLTGEIRTVFGLSRRLSEAARLGIKQVIVPRTGLEGLKGPAGVELIAVTNLTEAIMHAIDREEN